MDTNRNYKFLYYRTQEGFEADMELIPRTSIVFIREPRSIWTHGMYWKCGDVDASDQIKDKVDEALQEAENTLNEWEEHILGIVDALQNLIYEKHTEAINTAKNDLLSAKDKLLELEQTLAQLSKDGSTKTDIQILEGKITAITDWYNKSYLDYTRIMQQFDAINGKIITRGEYESIARNLVNNYSKEVDLKLAQLKEELKSTDVEELTDTVVGRLMDAETGILRDYATKTYVSQIFGDQQQVDVSNLVETYLDSKEPSWSAIASTVASVTGEDGELHTIASEWSNLKLSVDSISAISASLDELGERTAGLETHVSDLESSVGLFAIWSEGNEDTKNTIAAEIFAKANADGSEITLKANKITALGDFFASYINASGIRVENGENSITINGRGIKHTRGIDSAFELNSDGSGHLGYTSTGINKTYAISWDTNGVLTIADVILQSALGGSGNSEPTVIVNENPYNDTWIQNWYSTINSWKDTLDSWKDARAFLKPAGIILENIDADNVVAMTSISASSSNNTAIPAGISHTKISDNTKHGYRLNNDGTGQVAYGNISWNANGVITLKRDNYIVTTSKEQLGSGNCIRIYQAREVTRISGDPTEISIRGTMYLNYMPTMDFRTFILISDISNKQITPNNILQAIKQDTNLSRYFKDPSCRIYLDGESVLVSWLCWIDKEKYFETSKVVNGETVTEGFYIKVLSQYSGVNGFIDSWQNPSSLNNSYSAPSDIYYPANTDELLFLQYLGDLEQAQALAL